AFKVADRHPAVGGGEALLPGEERAEGDVAPQDPHPALEPGKARPEASSVDESAVRGEEMSFLELQDGEPRRVDDLTRGRRVAMQELRAELDRDRPVPLVAGGGGAAPARPRLPRRRGRCRAGA